MIVETYTKILKDQTLPFYPSEGVQQAYRDACAETASLLNISQTDVWDVIENTWLSISDSRVRKIEMSEPSRVNKL